MSHLQSLDLSYNSFPSKFPSCLYTLPTLQSLDLRSSNLGGVISKEIGNLTSIETLDLGKNSLQGKLPASMGNLCNLKHLDLGGNKYSGEISEAFESLSRCSLLNLEFLDISSNQLRGVVSKAHFANLTNLKELYASENSLGMRVSPDWIPPFHLQELKLSSWKLGPEFPMWLKSQKDIYLVELSNTRIRGNIPSWFWNLSASFFLLDFSHNQLHGDIPDLHDFDELFIVDMSSNKLTGSLPGIPSNLWWLDLSNNSFSGDIASLVCNPMGNRSMLRILKLGDNILEGNIPDHWMHWSSIRVIDLDNNKVRGEIPASMGLLRDLESLHLRNNSLIGEVPNSLHNCSSSNGLDLGLNKFVGSLPRWIGSLTYLRVFIIRSNNLTGHIPVEFCALVKLQILDVAHNSLSGSIPNCFKNAFAMNGTSNFLYLGYINEMSRENAILVTKGRENWYDNILHLVSILDLSSNDLSGEIPQELTSLRELQHLNLSNNHLCGSIPNKIGNMVTLESIDLSQNQLIGKIPPSMSNLNFLNYLNLSYNNLSGQIPKSKQLQSLPTSSFFGNRLLCGDPLLKRCKEGHKTIPQVKYENRATEDGGEEYWFKLGVAMGFGVGLLSIIAPLVLCGFWRRAYFWFIQEYIWYKILDCFIKFKHFVGISTPLHLA